MYPGKLVYPFALWRMYPEITENDDLENINEIIENGDLENTNEMTENDDLKNINEIIENGDLENINRGLARSKRSARNPSAIDMALSHTTTDGNGRTVDRGVFEVGLEKLSTFCVH